MITVDKMAMRRVHEVSAGNLIFSEGERGAAFGMRMIDQHA